MQEQDAGAALNLREGGKGGEGAEQSPQFTEELQQFPENAASLGIKKINKRQINAFTTKVLFSSICVQLSVLGEINFVSI